MGVKGWLKDNGFITETPEVEGKDPVTPMPSTIGTSNSLSPVIAPTPTFVPSTAASPVSVATPNQDIINTLKAMLDQSKVAGYAEFKVAFDTLGSLPDAQKYMTALKIVEAMNKITPAQVLASLDDRIKIMDKQTKDYEAAYQSDMQNSVTSAQKRAQDLAGKIEQKKKEIQEMEAERVKAMETAASEQIRIESDRAVFSVSHGSVMYDLTRERQNIGAFVTPNPTTK